MQAWLFYLGKAHYAAIVGIAPMILQTLKQRLDPEMEKTV